MSTKCPAQNGIGCFILVPEQTAYVLPEQYFR